MVLRKKKKKQKKGEILRKALTKVQLASPLKSRKEYKKSLGQKRRYKYNNIVAEHCGLRI